MGTSEQKLAKHWVTIVDQWLVIRLRASDGS
jgi:hypothetical protein